MTTIIGALLPLVLTLALGYFAAWHRDFKPAQASALNEMVLLYALPLLLVTGIVSVNRHELTADLGLATAILAAMLGTYVVTFVIVRYGLHKSAGLSGLTGLVVSSPSIAFAGYVVLDYLYGPTVSAVPVVVGALVLNVIVIPVTLVLLSLDSASTTNPPEEASQRLNRQHQMTLFSPSFVGGAGASSGAALDGLSPTEQNRPTSGDRSALSRSGTHRLDIKEHVASTVKQPVVWAPVLALVLVLAGVDLPSVVVKAMDLLGSATAGVAFFATGIVLFAQRVTVTRFVAGAVIARSIIVPAALWGILALLGMAQRDLRLAVLTLALPAPVLAVTFAVQYKQGQREMASMVLFSCLLSFVTLAGFIALT
jgi:malonate transporter and related proteins